MIAKHIALLAMRGLFRVTMPFTNHIELPIETRYFTALGDLANIPAERNTVATHPIISANTIMPIEIGSTDELDVDAVGAFVDDFKFEH